MEFANAREQTSDSRGIRDIENFLSNLMRKQLFRQQPGDHDICARLQESQGCFTPNAACAADYKDGFFVEVEHDLEVTESHIYHVLSSCASPHICPVWFPL